jgi:hypothetical protein
VLAFDEPGSQPFNGDPVVGLYALLVSSGRGLLVYSPPLIAGLIGFPAFARRRPAEAALIALVAAAYLASYATYARWDGGICWGPRYVMPLVGLLLLPAGELLAAGGFGFLAVALLGVAGAVAQVLGTAVDFQRVFTEVGFTRDTFFDPSRSPIVEHARYLTAGRFLDWLPVRIHARSGMPGVLAYVALPVALLGAAIVLALPPAWRPATVRLDDRRGPSAIGDLPLSAALAWYGRGILNVLRRGGRGRAARPTAPET